MNRLRILYSLEITCGASFKNEYPDYPVNSVLTLVHSFLFPFALLHLPSAARHNLEPFCLFARCKTGHVKHKQVQFNNAT